MRKPVKRGNETPQDVFESRREESTLFYPAGDALLAAAAAVCAGSCCDFCAGFGCGCCFTSWGGGGVAGVGANDLPLKVAIRQELPGESDLKGWRYWSLRMFGNPISVPQGEFERGPHIVLISLHDLLSPHPLSHSVNGLAVECLINARRANKSSYNELPAEVSPTKVSIDFGRTYGRSSTRKTRRVGKEMQNAQIKKCKQTPTFTTSLGSK